MGETHVIAERVHNNRRPHRAGTDENECREPTEQGGVCKLQHGAQYSKSNGTWVAQIELISMVDMRYMEKAVRDHLCRVL